MEYIAIEGGQKIKGRVAINGAKNAILPLLCASVLCDGVSNFTRVPELSDVRLACGVLESLGLDARFECGAITVKNRGEVGREIPRELMGGMRGTFMFLGAMLARAKNAVVYLPGGCRLGSRPIDIHLDALRALGARFESEGGCITASLPGGRFIGNDVRLRFPSVGATENALFAAALAHGRTRIIGAAREPEICDVARYLISCGAEIEGEGSDVITVRGVEALTGCAHETAPDRIEAATIIAATVITGGETELEGAREDDLGLTAQVFKRCGVEIEAFGAGLRVRVSGRLMGCGEVECAPFPRFATDAGPLLAAMMCFAEGKSEIRDRVFENRYGCARGLEDLGAEIKADGRSVSINGKKSLKGGTASAGDLRGAAALVCAALGCEGASKIYGTAHLDRGYAALERTLSSLGASARRKQD